MKQELITPTNEELEILRKKFNSIIDITFKKEIKVYNNYGSNKRRDNNKYTVDNDLPSNFNEIIDKDNQNDNKSKNYISNNSNNNNMDNDQEGEENISLNKESEIINQLILKNKFLSSENQSLKRELYLSSKQNTSNKQILANYIKQILDNNKGDLNSELITFLLDRVDKLEYQNYFLCSKIDNYIMILNQYIEDLCEYIDIIFDMSNVLNDIPENVINKNLNEDFFVVRDTLNNKKDNLNKKYEEYNYFKNVLDTNDIIKNNEIMLMLGNKINDINYELNNDQIIKQYSQIFDERIKKYENLINLLNSEENKGSFEKDLIINYNNLEKKNSQLRQIIKDIMSNDNYSSPIINKEIREKLMEVLNDETSEQGKNISYYNLFSSEDLLMALNAQCYINEIKMQHN
jgi:hypothetical protein